MRWLNRPLRPQATRYAGILSTPHSAPRTIPCSWLKLHLRSLRPNVRHFTINTALAARQRGTTDLDASVEDTTAGIHISQIASQLAGGGGVRDYLRQWSIKYQNDKQESAPLEVTLGRNTLLPNSLFVRDTTDDAPVVDEDDESLQEDDQPDREDASMSTVQLVSGDAFTMNAKGLRRQFALYLGHVGPQAQFLLADGRWYMALRSIYTSHIIHDFATEHEMATIRSHLPTKPVETGEVDGGGRTFVSAFGEVPFDLSSTILARFARLKEEGEDFKRDHARAVEQIHHNIASETEVRQLPLEQVVRQQLAIDYDMLSDGAKVVLLDKLYDDPSLSFTLTRGRFYLVTMPKRMLRDGQEAIAWARAYQDAAARAASGRDVSQDLQSNPLTQFISKARRIITKSRKVRAPTADGQLGPTLKSVLPVDGRMVRRSTGESFDENEKKIVQFLFSTYLLDPFASAPANKRNTSIGSMILRAVGAYPKSSLDSCIGKLFLQELGCIDPWAVPSEYNANIPLNWLGLSEPARLANEKQHAAMAQLNIPPGSKQPPFADTMAHMRKDWGTLEVFCVDSETTRVVDDGISIEPSKESPNHYWLHTHIAHPSAFIPFDHPLHEKPFLVGGSAYMSHTTEPAYPYELTDTLSMRPGGPVLTVSTLLARDGAVKDIRVVPGIVRNVIHINSKILEQTMGLDEPIVQELIVGQDSSTQGVHQVQSSKRSDTDDYNIRQSSLVSTHLKTFELIQDLLVARWEARKRENPDYLTMPLLSMGAPDVSVRRSNPDLNYQRIFRSEHCYGDPRIRVAFRKINFDETYDEQKRKYHPVAGCMLMTAESMGAWARRRQIPAIYRHQSFRFGYDLDKLNSLGQHEGYLGLASGESLSPSPHLMLNMAQMLSCTSPLRSMNDLVNLYQMDAYLKAEAAASMSNGPVELHPNYPRSREGLLQHLHGSTGYKGVNLTSNREQKHWVMVALFRAFYYGEAQLPEILDVQVGNPAKLGRETDLLKATLTAFGLRASLVPSEQGWEKLAKFRQFLPVKLQMLDIERTTVTCVAVGPPTDTPRIKDFAYPELRPRPSRSLGVDESAPGQEPR